MCQRCCVYISHSRLENILIHLFSPSHWLFLLFPSFSRLFLTCYSSVFTLWLFNESSQLLVSSCLMSSIKSTQSRTQDLDCPACFFWKQVHVIHTQHLTTYISNKRIKYHITREILILIYVAQKNSLCNKLLWKNVMRAARRHAHRPRYLRHQVSSSFAYNIYIIYLF